MQDHLVYNVKHCGRHKARLVADGHFTYIPVEIFYSGVDFHHGTDSLYSFMSSIKWKR